MKITKRQLKQLIKEELARAIVEQDGTPGDQASINKAAAIAKIVPKLDAKLRPAILDHKTQELLAGEIYRISGGDAQKSDHYINVVASNVKKTAGDQIKDSRAVKVVAEQLLEKLKAMPAAKSAKPSKSEPKEKHSAHHRKMKKTGETIRPTKEGEITTKPVRVNGQTRFVASAYKGGKQYKSKPYPNVEGAKADVRDQMATSR